MWNQLVFWCLKKKQNLWFLTVSWTSDVQTRCRHILNLWTLFQHVTLLCLTSFTFQPLSFIKVPSTWKYCHLENKPNLRLKPTRSFYLYRFCWTIKSEFIKNKLCSFFLFLCSNNNSLWGWLRWLMVTRLNVAQTQNR